VTGWENKIQLDDRDKKPHELFDQFKVCEKALNILKVQEYLSVAQATKAYKYLAGIKCEIIQEMVADNIWAVTQYHAGRPAVEYGWSQIKSGLVSKLVKKFVDDVLQVD